MHTNPDGTVPSPLERTTLFLRRDQTLFLDELSTRIHRGSGTVLKRAAIIRALIEGLRLSRIKVSGRLSEEILAKALAKCLSRGVERR